MNRVVHNSPGMVMILIFLFGTWKTSQAQITLFREDIPSTTGITKEFYTNAGGTVSVDVGPGGGPQYWDFSQGPTNESIIERIVDRESTPFYDLCPGANLVYDTNGLNIAGIDTASGFQYMVLDDQGLHLLGAGSENVLGLPLALALDSSHTMLELPLAYGAMWSDETEYVGIFEDLVENPSPNIFFPDPYLDVKVEIEMSTTSEVDAWGTVLLPYGEVEALRVRRQERTYMDASVFLGFVFVSVFDSTLSVITYEWYARDLGRVLTITSRPDESNPQFTEASRVRRLYWTDAVNRPPVITSVSTAVALEDKLFSYIAQGTDPDRDALTFSFVDYPSWLFPSGSTITGTPGEGTADTSFTVIAADGALFDSLLVEVTVIDVNDPPAIRPLPDTSFTSGDTVLLFLGAYVEDVDSPDSVLSWTASSFSESVVVSIEGQWAELTAPDYEGSTAVLFTVTDDSLASDSDTMGVTVLPRPNRSPRIVSDPWARAREDEPFHYVARATDPDGDSLTLLFSNYPDWLWPADSVLSGIPPEGTADTSFMVTATDGLLTDSLVVMVSVLAVNDPPVLAAFPDTCFTSDETLMIHLGAYVEDVDTPDSLLVWSAVPSTESLRVEIEEDRARLMAPDFQGEAWVLFSVMDDSLAGDTDTMFVTILVPTGVSFSQGAGGPDRFSLNQNYPNPFNPTTDIRYQIADNRYPHHTTLKIYNVLGQEVRSLVDEIQEAGFYTVTWDGRDSSGQQVSSGIYFSVLKSGTMSATRKMMMMK